VGIEAHPQIRQLCLPQAGFELRLLQGELSCVTGLAMELGEVPDRASGGQSTPERKILETKHHPVNLPVEAGQGSWLPECVVDDKIYQGSDLQGEVRKDQTGKKDNSQIPLPFTPAEREAFLEAENRWR
jgi:hypothetical protein